MLEEIKIENLIYEIRGKQVMLDSDLAKLYGYTNENKDMFKRLTTMEYKFLEHDDKIDELFYKL